MKTVKEFKKDLSLCDSVMVVSGQHRCFYITKKEALSSFELRPFSYELKEDDNGYEKYPYFMVIS